MPLGPLLVFGNDQPANPGASVLTLYCSDGIVSGGQAGTLQTTVPAASTSTTGWTVGTAPAPNYSRMVYNSERTAGTFTTTVQPSGAPFFSGQDTWRFGPSTGTFSGDTWYSSVSVIAVSSGGDQDGRGRFRLWRSNNADGTVVTELNGPQVGSLTTNLTTIVAQSSAASIFIPIFALSGEYLFYQVAWEITGLGAAADRDVLIRYGSMNQTDGSGLVTAPFASAATGTAAGGLLDWYYRAVVMDEC